MRPVLGSGPVNETNKILLLLWRKGERIDNQILVHRLLYILFTTNAQGLLNGEITFSFVTLIFRENGGGMGMEGTI